jgi:hypothetical protein
LPAPPTGRISFAGYPDCGRRAVAVFDSVKARWARLKGTLYYYFMLSLTLGLLAYFYVMAFQDSILHWGVHVD